MITFKNTDESRDEKQQLIDEIEVLRAKLHNAQLDNLNTIDTWTHDIHLNAADHGWWDEERSFPEIVALCHSELSEALEAYRNDEELVWFAENGKPEGLAVEMMDCVIRILDWFGHVGVDPEAILEAKHEYNVTRPYKHGGKRC